ncbi:hypothetical protein NQ317_013776 [Molorchus minor]|uniref:S1 motif domain-containing protein n=1 Tax=Molorchus minor TaxID=1323400 RepID=A0ABQ9IWR6_9CUCU|nr:hypothetical protein NQ317_013776 [Molorchus minor]
MADTFNTKQIFSPRDVAYTIVNEDGASIYSCSPEAKKEFPDLDTNIISAVSLARRIQDPLAELVKVEPQHIGVGMYQHDIKKKQLEDALSEVVSECVSFVGVDLNTASQCLLRRIAGLSEKRAAQIIRHREANGPFLYRKQLTDVSGIGARIFEQCAGFLRSEDIGEPNFIDTIKSKKFNIPDLSEELGSSEETIKLVLDTLGKPLNYDLRTEISQIPLFKKGLVSIHDINVGTIVNGRIKNVTHFGCFIDIGVGTDGLIHTSKLNGCRLQLGDRAEAKVINIEISKKRIGLEALKNIVSFAEQKQFSPAPFNYGCLDPSIIMVET